MSVNVSVTFPNATVTPYQTPDAATVATLRTLINTNQTPLRGLGAAITIALAAGGAALPAATALIDGTMYFAS